MAGERLAAAAGLKRSAPSAGPSPPRTERSAGALNARFYTLWPRRDAFLPKSHACPSNGPQ
jgi:hypothetical protein